MSCFDPETWRPFSKEEMLAYLDRMTGKKGKRARHNKGERKSSLVLRRAVSPFDAYTYLHARFGPPNGFQTFVARDDSDNLFHWDYNLLAGKKELTFIGATEEVHVWFDAHMKDEDCLRFINGLKADFARVGADKGRFASTLERWSIFPNQYLTIANRCAELYETIADALPRIDKQILADELTTEELILGKKRKSHDRLMSAVTTAPTELSVLMPVMFESFVGLIVAGLIKPEVKQDQEAFTEFVRSPLNQKLTQLADKCRGFQRPLEQNNPAFGRFWSVVNKRNDIMHGNVDPVRDALEIVYFDGKRPLFKSGGDRIRQHWLRLLDQYKPAEVIADYLATHEFIIEILITFNPHFAAPSAWLWKIPSLAGTIVARS